jgi:hypothetical protein
VNGYHEWAQAQLEAVRDKEWPPEPAEPDELEKHEIRVARHVRAGCEVGQFLALLSISESMIEIVELLQTELSERQAAATLGTDVAISRKEIAPMPALSPLTVDTNSNITFTEAPKDAAGNPVADTISFSSSNPAALDVTAAADGLSALAVTKAPGQATVTITDGVNTDTQDVTVTSGAPVTLGTTVAVVPKA